MKKRNMLLAVDFFKNKILLLGICFFLIPSVGFSVDKNSINVCDLGAIPNDGIDDTDALRKAVSYCRFKNCSKLIIPSGIYELKDEKAIDIEKKVMNGFFGNNPEKTIFTPYYPYAKGLDFSGMKNLTVQANGATLLCEGWMEVISLIDCENLKIEGLSIDYKRPPLSEGVVLNVENDYFDVKFSNARKMTSVMPYCRMTFWMKQKSRLYPNSIYFPSKEILDNNVVRFYHKIPKELKGEIAGIVHSFHFRPSVLVLRSNNIELNQLKIHSQSGMGVVGFDSKDILLSKIAVVPAEGRFFSTNTDATHFACCEGLLRFDECVFQGQGDDATNVHGYYHTITESNKDRVVIKLKARTYTHAQVLDAPSVGDTLELVEKMTLFPVKKYQVKFVLKNEEKFESKLVLSDSLPDEYGNYLLMNISKLPKVEFVNCIVNSHLARGVLIKSRNVLIQNNTFNYCTGTAIHVGAEFDWYEGSHAENVSIVGNLIIGCGNGDGTQMGASGIAVVIGAKDTKSSYLHRKIRIEDNIIVGNNNKCGIYVGNASDVVLINNDVKKCAQKINLNSVENVIIN